VGVTTLRLVDSMHRFVACPHDMAQTSALLWGLCPDRRMNGDRQRTSTRLPIIFKRIRWRSGEGGAEMILGSCPMVNRTFAPQPSPRPCRETGNLICKDGCYALRTDEGLEIWLEMEPIPLHLLDRLVHIEGARYQANLIQVEAIGPV
jgi:hypothetical protein